MSGCGRRGPSHSLNLTGRYGGITDHPRASSPLGDKLTHYQEFDTARDGVAVIEHPEPGEVIWRDERGVTCRRWNWRQCRRTALTEATENLWFVIDRLAPVPVEELIRAGDELVLGLRRLSPDLEAVTSLLEPGV